MRYQSDESLVDVSFRDDITEIDAPNAHTVCAYGCTALAQISKRHTRFAPFCLPRSRCGHDRC